MHAIYYLLIIGLAAFCLVLVVGLIVAARQRPSRHERTLEHIEKLEKGLGMGQPDALNDPDRATLPPGQTEDGRTPIRHPGDHV